MKTSTKFIGMVIWILMLTSCGQKTPTAVDIPVISTEISDTQTSPKDGMQQDAIDIPLTPTEISDTCCLGANQTSPKDGMQQIYVPAGEFLMGTDQGDNVQEAPLHNVYLDAFWIDQTPVTNAMFKKFADDQNFITDAEKKGWGYIAVSDNSSKEDGANWRSPQGPRSSIVGLDEFPVSQISWNDAKAYCEWAGRRLPTEAEWEKAARGTDGRTYPWGEEIDCGKANYWSGDNGCVGTLTAVGSYPTGASPYGALDMAGNVWEWVADWFNADYYQVSPVKNPTGPNSGIYRVLRGGSWFLIDKFVHTYTRQNLKSAFPDDSYFDYGFRCAMSEKSQDSTVTATPTINTSPIGKLSGVVSSLGRVELLKETDTGSFGELMDPDNYTYSKAIDQSHLYLLDNIQPGVYIIRFVLYEKVPQLTDLPAIGSPWEIKNMSFESTNGVHSGALVFSSPIGIMPGDEIRMDITIK